MSSQLVETLSFALKAATAQYEQQNPKSKILHQQATKVLPGGNARSILHISPFPICMKSGKGYTVTSEDEDIYTDLTGEYAVALYGHSHPIILDAMFNVLRDVGLNLGATTPQEQLFAKELCKRFDLQRVRFTNSGTEANLHAIAVSRFYTKKRRIVVFSGGYHGSLLSFTKYPPGIFAENVDEKDWIIAEFNNIASATRAIQSEGVAAVIVEGMQVGGGCVIGTPEFLRGIEQAAAEVGAIMILDEVVTSRISSGGFAGLYGLKPDIKTFGKYLGGGLAFGAFGGREDIMASFDIRQLPALIHSGTFNNNTLVTYTGYAGLTKIYTPEVAIEFTESGNNFLNSLNAATAYTKMFFTGLGTVMCFHFAKYGIDTDKNEPGAYEGTQELSSLFWFNMIAKRFWISPRGSIVLSLVTPQPELDRFLNAVKEFIVKYSELVAIQHEKKENDNTSSNGVDKN